MRRFRLTFSKGEEVRYISHLDLMRTWERILRRAGIKLAHSQGFNPRPRLVFAAPLPVGVTSQAEIVDVVVEDELHANEFAQRLEPALAPGIRVLAATEVGLQAPSAMASVLTADYVVELAAQADIGQTIEAFLASASVPYERSRKGTLKQADMRPAVVGLWLEDATLSCRGGGGQGEGPHPLRRALGMRLRLDVEGAAVRPDEVARALDPECQVLSVHRTALRLRDEQVGTLTLPSPGPTRTANAGEGGTGEGGAASHAA